MKLKIKKFDSTSFLKKPYGVLSGKALPKNITGKLPSEFAWCIIKPNSSTILHKHFEFEVFIVFKGKGEITSEFDHALIEELDCIYLEPFKEHKVINTGKEDLILLSVWGKTVKQNNQKNLSKESTVITSPPPTPNGDLHLGHLSGPYLTADIYRRILLMQGIEAVHHTGADTYQNHVLSKALKLDEPPERIAEKYTHEIKKTFNIYNIPIDCFLEPRKTPNYELYVQAVFQSLYEKGHIIIKEVDTTYNADNGRYLFESFVKGKCPYCKSPCGGNTCETCGMHNDCADLIDVKSTMDTAPVSIKKTHRFFFTFKKIMPKLLTFFDTIHDKKIKQYISYFLENEAKDYPVSHLSSWGIRVPFPKYKDQIIVSRFELVVGYLISLIDPIEINGLNSDTIMRIRSAYKEKYFVQMFGFDGSMHHVFIFPSICIGLGLPVPKGMKMNKFLQLEGKKFSTSRDHAIWCKEIAQKVSVDVLRYYLSWISPEKKETNFTLNHFKEFIAVAIENTIKPYIISISKTLENDFDNIAPSTTGWTDFQEEYYKELDDRIKKYMENYNSNLDKFSLNKITTNMFRFTAFVYSFHKYSTLYSANDNLDFQKTQIALELLSLKILSLLSYPIMPTFSQELWKSLCPNLSLEREGFNDYLSFIPSKTKIENLKKCLLHLT